MPFVIVKSRQEVLDQYKAALDKMCSFGKISLNEFYELDRENFAKLIEAAAQLGVNVDEDLQRKAGLVDINDLI